MLVLLIVGVLVLLLAAVLLSSIKIVFTGNYTLPNVTQTLEVFALYGLIHKHIVIQKKKRKKTSIFKKFFERSKKENILLAVKRLLHASKIPVLSVQVRIGTEDACQTALLTGGIYSVLTTLAAILLPSNKRHLLKKIQVSPDFNQTVLEGEIHCIISIQIAHIIPAMIIAWKGERKRHASN